VVVACTHFSLSAPARLSNARETAGFLDKLAGTDPVVLMGDLNAEPQSAEMRYLVQEAGFLDAWDAARAGEPGFTYSSFDPVRRIDYILVKNVNLNGTSAHLVGDSEIGGVYPSDHLGIVADLPDP
jgi:endonuclease/exonuclease/phosphatase family metal-dependent hydrolase